MKSLGKILEAYPSGNVHPAEPTEGNWAMRVLAAQALGRLGRSDRAGAAAPLTSAITGDPYALVREASLDALASFDAPDALPIARSVAATDPEPRVREAAAKLAR